MKSQSEAERMLSCIRSIKENAERLIAKHPLPPPAPLGVAFPIHLLPLPDRQPLQQRLHSLGLPSSASDIICQSFNQHMARFLQQFSESWRSQSTPTAPIMISAIQSHWSRLQADATNNLLRKVADILRASSPKQAKPSFKSEYVPFFEKYFEYNAYPSQADRKAMAKKSMMTEKQITIWFQNRRARAKRNGEPCHKLKHGDPIPNLHRAIEELKPKMKVFYIPEHERESKKRTEEPKPIERPRLVCSSPFLSFKLLIDDVKQQPRIKPSALNPRETSRTAEKIERFSRPAPLQSADKLTFTFQCKRNFTTRPAKSSLFNPKPVDQSDFEDLTSAFCCLNVSTVSRGKQVDRKAATLAFTYDCHVAPHEACMTHSASAYKRPPPPIDLNFVRTTQPLPSWARPHQDPTPSPPPISTVPTSPSGILPQHSESTKPARRRKTAGLPKRAAPRHASPHLARSTSVSSISSASSSSSSHSRQSSSSWSSASSSGPSTPESSTISLPVGIIPPEASEPLQKCKARIASYASQSSLYSEQAKKAGQLPLPAWFWDDSHPFVQSPSSQNTMAMPTFHPSMSPVDPGMMYTNLEAIDTSVPIQTHSDMLAGIGMGLGVRPSASSGQFDVFEDLMGGPTFGGISTPPQTQSIVAPAADDFSALFQADVSTQSTSNDGLLQGLGNFALDDFSSWLGPTLDALQPEQLVIEANNALDGLGDAFQQQHSSSMSFDSIGWGVTYATQQQAAASTPLFDFGSTTSEPSMAMSIFDPIPAC